MFAFCHHIIDFQKTKAAMFTVFPCKTWKLPVHYSRSLHVGHNESPLIPVDLLSLLCRVLHPCAFTFSYACYIAKESHKCSLKHQLHKKMLAVLACLIGAGDVYSHVEQLDEELQVSSCTLVMPEAWSKAVTLSQWNVSVKAEGVCTTLS